MKQVSLRRVRVDTIPESGIHARHSQNHLRNRIGNTSYARRLPQKIRPPNEPCPEGDMLRRDDVLRHKIHATFSNQCIFQDLPSLLRLTCGRIS